jgi:hypothetical protein
MRLITVAALVGLLATPALGDTMAHCSAAWKAMTPAQKNVMTYKAWSAKCLAKDYMVPANENQITGWRNRHVQGRHLQHGQEQGRSLFKSWRRC